MDAADDDIRNWAREEDYVLYLARRRKGDPIPHGVSPENPFTADPWDLYDDSWYHFHEIPNENNNWEGDVRKTGAGIWKRNGTVTIPTESALGFRNSFEFYQGNNNMFVGTKTGWRIYQYTAGHNNKEGSSKEDVTLCKLFWNNEERVSSSALNNSPVEGAGVCTLGTDVIASKESRELSSRNISQDNFIELKDITSSDGEIRELNDNNFSERDYMEFDDILTSDTDSTSSDNSSNISVSSNEYIINVDELLGDITGPVQFDQNVRENNMLNGGMNSDKENNNSPCYDFSTGDYLELRDFLPSNNLGEHFDINELLRDNTAMDAIAPVENSINSSPVSLTGAASVTSCTGNNNTEAADKEQPSDHQPDVGASASLISRAGKVKRNLSDRSEGVSSSSGGSDNSSSGDESSFNGSTGSGNDDGCKKKGKSKTPKSKRRRSVKRLADIGKKFFCFK